MWFLTEFFLTKLVELHLYATDDTILGSKPIMETPLLHIFSNLLLCLGCCRMEASPMFTALAQSERILARSDEYQRSFLLRSV
jgi:hypothetical protein